MGSIAAATLLPQRFLVSHALTFDELGDRIDGADKESFPAVGTDADGFFDHGKWNHAKEAFDFGTRSGGNMGKTQ